MLYFGSPKALRESSALDRLISSVDRGLRAATGVVNTPRRPNPAGCTEEGRVRARGARGGAIDSCRPRGRLQLKPCMKGSADARSAERAAGS